MAMAPHNPSRAIAARWPAKHGPISSIPYVAPNRTIRPARQSPQRARLRGRKAPAVVGPYNGQTGRTGHEYTLLPKASAPDIIGNFRSKQGPRE